MFVVYTAQHFKTQHLMALVSFPLQKSAWLPYVVGIYDVQTCDSLKQQYALITFYEPSRYITCGEILDKLSNY